MVKGVARRVIVVHAPDPKLFEQAIFLVREEALRGADSPERVLQEARQVADGYLQAHTLGGKRLRPLPPIAFGAIGAGLATAFWFLIYNLPLF